jgi:hypothetical protein
MWRPVQNIIKALLVQTVGRLDVTGKKVCELNYEAREVLNFNPVFFVLLIAVL